MFRLVVIGFLKSVPSGSCLSCQLDLVPVHHMGIFWQLSFLPIGFGPCPSHGHIIEIIAGFVLVTLYIPCWLIDTPLQLH